MTVRVQMGAEDSGRRLDVVVAQAAGVSRARAGELLGRGRVLVGGRAERKSYRVAAGDVVEVELGAEPEAPAEAPPKETTGIDVVFEDDHLLVVYKPAGVVVHRAAGVRSGTLVDVLLERGVALAAAGGSERPGIVHRLDKDVSGVLVVAKTDEAHAMLSEMMRERSIDRRYVALVHGAPGVDKGKIDAPIGRDPRRRTRMSVIPDGRSSVTWFAVSERLGETAVLDVKLETGRTHQIRTHLASIGHPIVGDSAYGRDRSLASRLGLRRPFLHAYRLSFDHPKTGERVDVRSDLPEELVKVLEELWT